MARPLYTLEQIATARRIVQAALERGYTLIARAYVNRTMTR